MNLLVDPNVLYLALVVGLVLGILALFAPGTGLLEVGAMFALVLAGIGAFSLNINFWALGVLVLGGIPFILALRKSGNWIYLVLTIAAVVIGSWFFFRTPQGGPAVNFWLALLTSFIATIILWIVGKNGLEALHIRKDFDLTRLMETFGEARTNIFKEGTVYINGEEWSAWSEMEIPAGSRVRVIGRVGLSLQVETTNE